MLGLAKGVSAGRQVQVALLPSAVIVAVALIAGVAAARFGPMAAVAAAVVLAGSVVLTRSAARADAVATGWVPAAWVALLFVSDHSFINLAAISRSPLDAAAGRPSIENVVELGVYAVVGIGVIRSRRLLVERGSWWSVPKVPLLLFPMLAVISVAWSTIPLFSFTRAAQLLVMVGLALLMVRVWQRSPERGIALWRASLGMLVQVTTILAIAGLVYPVEVSGRFTWLGSDPGSAAVWAAASFLVLMVGGRSFAPAPRWAFWPRLVVLALALNLTLTRGVIFAVAFSIAVVLWDLGREKPIARYLGLWYYASAALVVAAVAEATIFQYLSRGESTEAIFSLSGRIPLWQQAIGDLLAAGKLLLGYGYGAARVVLFPQVEWAGSAHSTWVEALMGTGIIGVIALAGTMGFLAWRLAVADRPTREARVALGFLAFIFVAAAASEFVVLPGSGFGLLALASVPALSRWKRFGEPSRVPADGASRPATDQGLASFNDQPPSLRAARR